MDRSVRRKVKLASVVVGLIVERKRQLRIAEDQKLGPVDAG